MATVLVDTPQLKVHRWYSGTRGPMLTVFRRQDGSWCPVAQFKLTELIENLVRLQIEANAAEDWRRATKFMKFREKVREGLET